MSSHPDRPLQSGLNHLGISVTDLDRSIAFYCDVLGGVLAIPPRAGHSPSSSWVFAVVVLGPLAVDIYQHSDNGRETFTPSRTGLDHLGLSAETRDDLLGWARWLDAKGVERSEIRDAVIGEIFDFADPDGIQLEFFYLDPERRKQSVVFGPGEAG
jgi:catechol 2,3-dioxygenase-like lactoylglutathione lyase family enzyme